MYIAPIDMAILKTLDDSEDAYKEKFGEYFPCFNYADFQGDDERIPAQQYKDLLEQALKEGKPYRIKSELRSFLEL